MRKKKPPYARELGTAKDVRVFCGGRRAWKMASYWVETGGCGIAAIALPEPNPEEYDWTDLRGRDVFIWQAGSFPLEALQRLGNLIHAVGPSVLVVRYVTSQGVRITSYSGWHLQLEGGRAEG